MEIWTDAQLGSIHKMLNPRSIAVVGATPRLQYGGRMLAAALTASDRVNVYPVNPRYDEIMGAKCYPTVLDLPEAPDLVGVVVPYDKVLAVLKESHQRGAGSAIVISAGFAERGVDSRSELQRELGDFAVSSGMRISGPNCLGMANIKDGIWVSASSRGAQKLAGPVGLVCQSGASAFGPFLNRAVDAGIGLSYVISTGNEADLDFSDFVRYLLDDPGTKAIAGFVEGFKDARKFIEVAKVAAQRGKPIVLIKIGRSQLGAQAALSHTATLTGADALYDAAMAQHGVIRVQDYDELLEVSHLLAHSPKPSKTPITVVSHSGGISSLTADMCGEAGLELPPLSDDAKAGIDEVLKGFGWAANPADVTGFANSESFPEIMEWMVNEPEVGTMVVASSGGDPQAEQVIAQRDRLLEKPVGEQKGVVFLWTGSRNATSGLSKLKEAGIPVFYTPNRLASGLSSYLRYHAWLGRRMDEGFPTAPEMSRKQREQLARFRRLVKRSKGGQNTLSEFESKQLISVWGIPATREFLASSLDEATQAAKTLGYPVALKADSPLIPHKTEAGVIALGVNSDDELADAYNSVMAHAAGYLESGPIPRDRSLLEVGPGESGHGSYTSESNSGNSGINGVLVQEMIADAVEVIVGVSYDSQLGPVLLFGTGGVMVEVYNDVALRLCPVSPSQAREMVSEVRDSRLLRGFRGQAPKDVDALVEGLVQVSHLAVNLQGTLSELDINPLMVLPRGQGIKAADALVVLEPE